jgi:hypothetical protein
MNSKVKVIAILVGAALAGPAIGFVSALKFAPSQTDAESAANASAPIQHKPEVMYARITRELIDGTSCSEGAFNNTTGQITGIANPCNSMSRKNDTSAAAPMGTIHRLEAIQDSFFEKNEAKSNSSIK